MTDGTFSTLATWAWRRVRYRGAVVVQSREELDAALVRAPAFIVVEGTGALRAHAASLARRGHAAGSWDGVDRRVVPPVGGGGRDGLTLPPVGRIRTGLRERRGRVRRSGATRLPVRAGVGAVLAACLGIMAALMLEWLSFLGGPEGVRAARRMAPHESAGVSLATRAGLVPAAGVAQWAIPVLAIVALGSLVFMIWQALGARRQGETAWRVDHRVQGRLVIARVRG